MASMALMDEDLVAFAAVAGAGGVLGAYTVRVVRQGRFVTRRLASVPGTTLLGRYFIEAFHWVACVVGRRLARMRVSPDALTVTSLLVTSLTLPLSAMGHFEAAGGLLLFGAAFDALDGIVARERGLASEAGEILDSVLDRYADACPLIGMAIFWRASVPAVLVVMAALLGSQLVSYVRSKAEKLGLALASTVMRRPERIAYLSGGLLAGPALSSGLAPLGCPHPVTLAAAAIVAVASHVAAVQLLSRARRQLKDRSRPALPRPGEMHGSL